MSGRNDYFRAKVKLVPYLASKDMSLTF